MPQKTQDDIVRDQVGYLPKEDVRKVMIPGMETLHTRSIPEIAEVLANVLRMEPSIKELRWVVGEYFELTSQK